MYQSQLSHASKVALIRFASLLDIELFEVYITARWRVKCDGNVYAGDCRSAVPTNLVTHFSMKSNLFYTRKQGSVIKVNPIK